MTAEIVPSVIDRIKQTMVGLKMPCAMEILDATVRRLERGEMTALEAIDALLAEEFTLRENRRVKTALVMARLSTIKTLAGFDFSFSSPSGSSGAIREVIAIRLPSGDQTRSSTGCFRSVSRRASPPSTGIR